MVGLVQAPRTANRPGSQRAGTSQDARQSPTVGAPSGPLRTGTVRGPIQSLMQPCSLCCRLGRMTASRPRPDPPARGRRHHSRGAKIRRNLHPGKAWGTPWGTPLGTRPDRRIPQPQHVREGNGRRCGVGTAAAEDAAVRARAARPVNFRAIFTLGTRGAQV